MPNQNMRPNTRKALLAVILTALTISFCLVLGGLRCTADISPEWCSSLAYALSVLLTVLACALYTWRIARHNARIHRLLK